MCSDKMLCCLVNQLPVELAAVVAGKVGRERILALAAMQEVQVLLALAGETGVKIGGGVLAGEDADVVRQLTVHATDKALGTDIAVRFDIEAERPCVNTGIRPGTAVNGHGLIQDL